MLQKEKFNKSGKKRLFGAVILAFLFIVPFACSDISQEDISKKEPSKKSADEKEVKAGVQKSDSSHKSTGNVIFNVVEQMPEFPGGRGSLRNYLAKKVDYPAEARENGREGKVYVGFIIKKNGKVANVHVKKGAYKSLNTEAMNVVKNMPDWNPGKQSGEKVSVRYVVPVKFSLPDNENDSQ